MAENRSHGVQERINHYTRKQLAYLAMFGLLAGWLGGRYEAADFGILFWLGFGAAGWCCLAYCRLDRAVDKLIRQLEEQ